jgi:23S rRNA (pseudouridine1915-N3)-methyltransferase
MKIQIVAIGRLKAGPERDLFVRYAERIAGSGRTLGLSGPHVIELPESQAKRDADRKTEEAAALLAALEAQAFAVALDERGQMVSSAAFAEQLGRQRDEGRKLIQFVIGGADGLDDALRTRVQWRIAFGSMTMPHQLVRVLLAEQIYRACTLLSGHPYHRA